MRATGIFSFPCKPAHFDDFVDPTDPTSQEMTIEEIEEEFGIDSNEVARSLEQFTANPLPTITLRTVEHQPLTTFDDDYEDDEDSPFYYLDTDEEAYQ